ncbi:DUF885 domain-containing protein [Actinomadura vinacea]|uniref:DUF885 domain-containing protein n=1 Tax=Actinomadura vinacea TaxID=115336 RepID=A0ABP5X9Y1_9ACTN
MSALDELADRYVEEFAGLDPCTATIMGIAGYDAGLTDYGPEGVAARSDLSRRTLAALDALPRPGGKDADRADAERVAAEVLRERLETELALDEARVRDHCLDTTDGPVQRLRYAFELLDQGEDTDWETVGARVRALPAALENLRAGLLRACQQGRVSARRQVGRSARSCVDLRGHLSGLAGRGGGLEEPVRAAAQALTGFVRFLEEELAPHAPERDPLGADRYHVGVRDFLGTSLDLEETYAWGWEELARIEAEMAALADRISPGRTPSEVAALLDADPAYRVGAGDFVGYIQELADRAIDDLDGVHFDIPAPLRRVDCRLASSDAGVYYLAPAEDLSRPGTVWWWVHPAEEEIVTWSVPAVMFHEGVPGHHLQLGTTALNTATLNRFQRVSAELYPGHGEGWGLYAERLMGELGYYRDPAHRLGMLADGQQIRAARVVLDIGMHLELPIPAGTGFHEGERWTPRLGWEFLRAHSGPWPDEHVTFEIDRYLGRPGQAIAYKLGEKVWLEAREAARRRDGAAFDLKAFHRRALDLGPMGLDRLRAELVGPA